MVSNVVGGPLDGALVVEPDAREGLFLLYCEGHYYAWCYARHRWDYEGLTCWDEHTAKGVLIHKVR